MCNTNTDTGLSDLLHLSGIDLTTFIFLYKWFQMIMWRESVYSGLLRVKEQRHHLFRYANLTLSLTFCLSTALSWEVSRRDVPSPALVIITKQLLCHTSLVKALERIFTWQVALQVFTWQVASVQGGISRARVSCWCLRLVNFRQWEELVSWPTHGSCVRWWGNFCFPHYTFPLQVRPKASWI